MSSANLVSVSDVPTTEDVFRERFATVLDNYQTTMAHGGTFILLIHDLWGADGTQNSSAPYPGDNGDWTSWDNYLTQLFSDLNANGMTTKLVVDIWNEPDLTAFWTRTQDQYLQMWGRTYYRWRYVTPLHVFQQTPSLSLLGDVSCPRA